MIGPDSPVDLQSSPTKHISSPYHLQYSQTARMYAFLMLCISSSTTDLRRFRTPPPIGMCGDSLTWAPCGAYMNITTVSAFSAVNFLLLPPLVRWLSPTAIGVPAIAV